LIAEAGTNSRSGRFIFAMPGCQWAGKNVSGFSLHFPDMANGA